MTWRSCDQCSRPAAIVLKRDDGEKRFCWEHWDFALAQMVRDREREQHEAEEREHRLKEAGQGNEGGGGSDA